MISKPSDNESVAGEIAYVKGRQAEQKRFVVVCRAWIEHNETGDKRGFRTMKINAVKGGGYMERDENGVPKVLKKAIDMYKDKLAADSKDVLAQADDFERETSQYKEENGELKKKENM